MGLFNLFYGFFSGSLLSSLIGLVLSFSAVLFLGHVGAPLLLWVLAGALIGFGFKVSLWLLLPLMVLSLLFLLRPLRRRFVTLPLMEVAQKFQLVPTISPTERTALEAGVVWIEKDLFSGSPDFSSIFNEPYPELTKEERTFMEGPLRQLCAMIDDWKIWKEREFPEEVWDFMKKEKFWGMIIPKEYGGLAFSALAHSHVIKTIASRSTPVGVTVMVPNSLGPAELIIHYGTDEQKKYFLPRLARGEEVPCFALTEPGAGSDAASLEASGVLFKGDDGKLYLRLNWNKRWITLAAISTIVGLAFRLRDPENILGQGEDVGITCALIPSKTPGVILGNRHDPLGVPFFNCPTQGKDVVVSADAIIGGVVMAGKGWKMLMESLAVGRGISLPAQATGEAQLVTRMTSAHAFLRRQFGVSIGLFEGIQEPLARMGGITYTLEALRRFTLGALDKGIKPPVITAIAKYNATELARKVVNDGMDILAGTGISLGPKNTVGHRYISAPIGITVEGANILTRTLIIYGQGALRAHPFAYDEVKALEEGNVVKFDKIFWGHVNHVVKNTFRSFLLGISRGRLAPATLEGELGRYVQKLSWASASFAWVSDLTMAVLGGGLKQKEMITGRLADILSWMYIGTCVLRRYVADGRKTQDLPFVHYSMKLAFKNIQQGFEGLYANLNVPRLRWFFRGPFLLWVKVNSFDGGISDKLTQNVALHLLTDGDVRDRLTGEGIYLPTDPKDAVGRIEEAFQLIQRSELSEQKIKKAVKKGVLPKRRAILLLDEALAKGIITEAEMADLKKGEEIRKEVIQVDDFTQEEYLTH